MHQGLSIAKNSARLRLGLRMIREARVELLSETAMNQKITTKGQVTIPQEIRDRFGLTPGSRVVFDVVGDSQVALRKANAPDVRADQPSSRFAKLRGSATAGLSTDEIIALG
jgi:AbrB family looped-hinge helix DNA binding protein